jgi:hypothetical protein
MKRLGTHCSLLIPSTEGNRVPPLVDRREGEEKGIRHEASNYKRRRDVI